MLRDDSNDDGGHGLLPKSCERQQDQGLIRADREGSATTIYGGGPDGIFASDIAVIAASHMVASKRANDGRAPRLHPDDIIS
ncbi:MAG: hypothetical protein AAGD47_14730 [Pseudomonadota bacterium]